MKRLVDVIVAIGLLCLSVPLLFAVAVMIKADSPGPVFFRQTRTGLGGRHFTLLKLRTMIPDAEAALESIRHLNEADGPLFKVTDDPRVTQVGGALRRLSIDELPQLWNVIRGHMSLVGPRPALPDEVEEWPPHAFRRLDVKPGLTGPWQVSGRSALSFDDYVRCDLTYVDNWSPGLDMAIMAKTVPAVLTRKGAH